MKKVIAISAFLSVAFSNSAFVDANDVPSSKAAVPVVEQEALQQDYGVQIDVLPNNKVIYTANQPGVLKDGDSFLILIYSHDRKIYEQWKYPGESNSGEIQLSPSFFIASVYIEYHGVVNTWFNPGVE